MITINEFDRCCCRYLCVYNTFRPSDNGPPRPRMQPTPIPSPGLRNSPPRHTIDSWKWASKLPCIPWLFLAGDIYHHVLTALLQHKQRLGPRRAVFILSGSYCLESIPRCVHQTGKVVLRLEESPCGRWGKTTQIPVVFLLMDLTGPHSFFLNADSYFVVVHIEAHIFKMIVSSRSAK